MSDESPYETIQLCPRCKRPLIPMWAEHLVVDCGQCGYRGPITDDHLKDHPEGERAVSEYEGFSFPDWLQKLVLDKADERFEAKLCKEGVAAWDIRTRSDTCEEFEVVRLFVNARTGGSNYVIIGYKDRELTVPVVMHTSNRDDKLRAFLSSILAPQKTGQWANEHGVDYDVPYEILDLVEAGRLEDASWGNDTCPKFAVAGMNGDEDPREGYGYKPECYLWVEHPDSDEREMGGYRFAISIMPSGGGAEDGVEVINTDDLQGLLSAVRGIEIAAGFEVPNASAAKEPPPPPVENVQKPKGKLENEPGAKDLIHRVFIFPMKMFAEVTREMVHDDRFQPTKGCVHIEKGVVGKRGFLITDRMGPALVRWGSCAVVTKREFDENVGPRNVGIDFNEPRDMDEMIPRTMIHSENFEEMGVVDTSVSSCGRYAVCDDGGAIGSPGDGTTWITPREYDLRHALWTIIDLFRSGLFRSDGSKVDIEDEVEVAGVGDLATGEPKQKKLRHLIEDVAEDFLG